MPKHHLTVSDALARLPGPPGARFVELLHRVGPGDLLFVPARVPHRFDNFTDDLVVWVIFYGPEGGEIPR